MSAPLLTATTPNVFMPVHAAANALAEVGRRFHARGWVLGTSGNVSVITWRDPLRLSITATGVDKAALDKAALDATHILEIDEHGPVHGDTGRPSADESLAAWAPKTDALEAQGGYVVADVVDGKPETPQLDAMRARFSSEHWHDADEVRLIVEERGPFHIHSAGRPVFALELEAGDLIRVPRGTHDWFDLGGERRIRAIRLVQDPSGWTPPCTERGEDAVFQPLCVGPAYIPPARVAPGYSV